VANKDRIVVWMNGKRTTIKRGKSTPISQDTITKEEHAATIDNHPYENNGTLDLPETDERNNGNQFTSKGSDKYKLKPLIIAIISAVCIGGIFGLIMLKVVGSLGDHGADQPTANGAVSSVNQDEENHTSGMNDRSGDTINTFPGLKSYVIQGGVFEEKSSVDEWKSSFQDAAFSPVVWKRDGKYYLFVGIAKTKAQANTYVKDIIGTYGLDVFAKKWVTKEASFDFNKEGQQWIDTAIELWIDSVASIDDRSGFPIEDWKELVVNAPDGMELDAFHEKLKQLTNDLDNPSDHEIAGFLLNVWMAMEDGFID